MGGLGLTNSTGGRCLSGGKGINSTGIRCLSGGGIGKVRISLNRLITLNVH